MEEPSAGASTGAGGGGGGSGGVSNIRAMFEARNEQTSPPSRGRSPAGGEPSENPRPMSKVRASFISVDRGARAASSVSSRKMSNASQGPPALDAEKPDPAAGKEQTEESTKLSDKASEGENGTAPANAAEVETDGIKNEENVEETAKTKDATEGREHGFGGASLKSTVRKAGIGKTPPLGNKVEPKSSRPTSLSTKPATKSNPKPSPTVPKDTSSRPAPKSTLTRTTSRRQSQAIPPKVETNGTDTKSSVGASKTPLAKPTAAMATNINKPQRTSSIRTTQSKASTSANTSTNANAPKRSPTLPSRLPGAATAPTASSAAKTANGSPSRSAAASRKTSTSHRASSISGPDSIPAMRAKKQARPSLGPPPPKAAEKLPTHSSKAVEGSFLERMMKPTASSASKTHEKVEAKSPPRPRAAAAATKLKKKIEPIAAKLGVNGGPKEKDKEAEDPPLPAADGLAVGVADGVADGPTDGPSEQSMEPTKEPESPHQAESIDGNTGEAMVEQTGESLKEPTLVSVREPVEDSAEEVVGASTSEGIGGPITDGVNGAEVEAGDSTSGGARESAADVISLENKGVPTNSLEGLPEASRDQEPKDSLDTVETHKETLVGESH